MRDDAILCLRRSWAVLVRLVIEISLSVSLVRPMPGAARNKALRLTRLQLPGGKPLGFADLYNSRREQFAPGLVLGQPLEHGLIHEGLQQRWSRARFGCPWQNRGCSGHRETGVHAKIATALGGI